MLFYTNQLIYGSLVCVGSVSVGFGSEGYHAKNRAITVKDRAIFRAGKTPKTPFLALSNSLLPNPTEMLARQANTSLDL